MTLEGKSAEVVPTLKRNLPDMVSEPLRWIASLLASLVG